MGGEGIFALGQAFAFQFRRHDGVIDRLLVGLWRFPESASSAAPGAAQGSRTWVRQSATAAIAALNPPSFNGSPASPANSEQQNVDVRAAPVPNRGGPAPPAACKWPG